MKPAPLTDRQKREIVRLRRAKTPWKIVIRQIGCTFAQAFYAWRVVTDAKYAPGGHRIQQVLRAQRIRRAIKALDRGRKWDGALSLDEAHEVMSRRAARLEMTA